MLKIRPLGIEAELVTSFLGQAVGFMFHLPGKKAKIFAFKKERRAGIHMFFVFFPLIVVWLDGARRVKYFKFMRPFTSFASHKAKYVIEVPYNAKFLRKIGRSRSFSWREF